MGSWNVDRFQTILPVVRTRKMVDASVVLNRLEANLVGIRFVDKAILHLRVKIMIYIKIGIPIQNFLILARLVICHEDIVIITANS